MNTPTVDMTALVVPLEGDTSDDPMMGVEFLLGDVAEAIANGTHEADPVIVMVTPASELGFVLDAMASSMHAAGSTGALAVAVAPGEPRFVEGDTSNLGAAPEGKPEGKPEGGES